MEITVLGYRGIIRETVNGFYVEFYETGHWRTTGLIAKKYHLLENERNLNSSIKWRILFSRLRNIKFKDVYYTHCRFPEFKNIDDLYEFVKLLNNNLQTNSNFINLNYII